MKAPDKIYVAESRKIIGDIEHNVFSEQPFLQGSIEYIRKDLILEWAKELASEPYDRTTESALKHQIAHYLLEKYNSL